MIFLSGRSYPGVSDQLCNKLTKMQTAQDLASYITIFAWILYKGPGRYISGNASTPILVS